MNDVMKKRVVGAGVLVILGIVLPLLLARCLHGGDAGNSESTRVYEITPDGEAQPAESENSAVAETRAPDSDRGGKPNTLDGDSDGSGGVQSADKQQPPMPQAVSPSADDLDTLASSGSESFDSSSIQGNAPDTRSSDPPSTPAGESSAAGNDAQSAERAADANENQNENDFERTPSQLSGWIVQVASFGDKNYAQRLARQLNRDYEAFYRAGDVNGKTWYRVGVGPFASEAEAQNAASGLRQQGRSTLVRQVQ